ncbi:MAG TPA: DUF308 domain-containing protein [Solirubrobacteraceae bacterium]|nr:DUF308 domain-containing protein [Solirubrobacteraceae bacterium]
MNASSSRRASEWDPVTIEGAARAWWLGLVVGIVSIVGGIVVIAYPGPTLTVIALLVGIELLIGGIFLIVAAFGEPAGSRAAGVLAGALAVIAGVIVLRHPSESVLVVALAVGIYLILAGVLRLVGAVEASEGRGWLVLAALVDLALGIVIVSWPKFGITTLAIVLGIVLIVRGLALVVIAFVLRALEHDQAISTAAGPTAPAA